MGFGSYDESEQENQEGDTDYDEDDAVNVHENDHEGDVSVTGGDDTSSLVDQLQTMKGGDEDDE
ncbi:DUF5786 family protein [Halospeciosus flavus]|uniref:DUF5786 family protein n=1 Tax=Halospeciosus flavus TaxID=3032283 RepID=A0ABD5Z8P1_9EURY|nr:DUF5786 family protein [Halospeciosus flavus]